jgi:hypothetical protein
MSDSNSVIIHKTYADFAQGNIPAVFTADWHGSLCRCTSPQSQAHAERRTGIEGWARHATYV